MMIKKKSNPWARLKYLYVLPLAAVTVAAFARPEVSNKLDEISSVKVNDLTSIVETIGVENEDSVSKNQWFPAVPVTETDTVARLPIKLEVGKKPLFIIDGKPFGTYLSLDDIDASMVESATLLDKTEAMKLYGEKAKDGALVITSKHPERTKVHRGVQFNVPSASDKKFKVSGTVLAADTKIPVMGASVIIRGTTNGTLTDHDGKFTLGGLRKGDVIQVSFVGFQTRSVIIKDESPLTIMLDDDVQNLDEMLVVGMNSNGDGTTAVKVQIKKKSGEKSYLEGKMTSTKKDSMTVNQVDWQKKSSYDEPQEKVIFQVVEEMPEFPGGMAEAMKFLGKNIKYPVSAQEAKIEGRVIVQFVVERDGSVSDVKVMRGVNPELDAEAIRVVSMMPNWIPGKQRGKAVAVKYTMPIMFRLQTSVPKAEETAQGFQHISLKVDKDAAQADVDMVKDHLRNRNPYGEDGNTIVLRTRGASKGKSTDNVLVIVDGEIKGYGQSTLNTVPVDQVESLEIMKKETAIAQYGDKVKDAVVSIVTKKNKK